MRILLIDDEAASRETIAEFFDEQFGYQVTQCSSAQEALDYFNEEPFPIILTDICMPGMSGLEFLEEIRELPQGKHCAVILITGYAEVENAVEALRKGASDYLCKPINLEELAAVITRIVEQGNLTPATNESYLTPQDLTLEVPDDRICDGVLSQNINTHVPGIGKVGIFSEALRAIVSVASRLHEDRSVPVLIEGETGTGKEIIARLVHHGDAETSAPFISVNCSAITPSLFESELFGYEKGAFTGATRSGVVGKLELANNGTLFLDEIGDLPLDLQPKLLRALQEKEIYRVGGTKKIPLDVRIIAATNHNLEKRIEKGAFRQDLYYRLNIGLIHLPPLREQREAIGPLAQMFLIHFGEQKKRRFRFISKEALHILESHTWSGNIRELKNVIDRVVLLYDDIELKSEHLSFFTYGEKAILEPGAAALQLGSIALPDNELNLETLEAEVVRKALLKFDGNKSKAARYLGLTRSALRSRLSKVL